MLKQLNMSLVKEWYKLIRSYNVQQLHGMATPEKFFEFSAIFQNMGCYYHDLGTKSIYWYFYSSMTTHQLERLREKVVGGSVFLTPMQKADILLAASEEKGYYLPCDWNMDGIAACQDSHIWAALLSSMPEATVYSVMLRLPDADYHFPSLGYLNFPMCYPFDFSQDAFDQAIRPMLPKDVEAHLEPILVRELFNYPVLDVERLEEN